MLNRKILILVPSLAAKGGVASYFQSLNNRFSIKVEYFVRGSRTLPFRRSHVNEICRAFIDFLNYSFLLRTNNYTLIHINTSLGLYGFIRDGLFLILGKLFRKRVIVFFRGWDKQVEKNIQKRYLPLFKSIFFKADAIIVLSSQFKEKLILWGYHKPIYTETTAVDESLLKSINIDFIKEKYEANFGESCVLFLSRIEKSKGIYEALETYHIIKKRFPLSRFVVAGDGSELNNAKSFVKKKDIREVVFPGFVTGRDKIEIFKRAHIFFFPTFHGEGMPNAVLEAMAFGLPVVTRPVGGLSDFFENGNHGFITLSDNPHEFAHCLVDLLGNKDLMLEMALYNFHYARQRFTPSRVIERLESIYKTLI